MDDIIQRIDKQIDECFKFLETGENDSEEYKMVLERVNDFVELKNKILTERKENSSKFHISGDVAVSSITSLLEILLILNYEKLNVIGSKALGFMHKPR